MAEKTAELQQAQRQVLHMEKMASLGKLSATVAHEINNPLTGMLIYAGLSRRDLQEQPLDPAVREEVMRYLSVIERECRRCGGIVQNLLLFARRSGASMAPVDVNDVVRQSLMLVEHHLHMSGLKLQAEFLEGDSRITADGGQLQQALVALLVNAVEAMSGLPEGQGELVVGLHGTADSIRIDIGDNGIGIPSDVLPQIFEPFFSTKEAENGVGLGLSVVYGIVQRHGGRIEVDSKVGKGTTFHLTLPRQPPAETAETRSRKQNHAPLRTHPDRRRRVLRPRLARPLVPQGRLRGPGGGRRHGGDRQAMQSAAFDVVLLGRAAAGHGRHALARADPPHRPRDDRDHDHGLCFRRYGRAGSETGGRGLCHQADQSGGAQPRGGPGPGPAAIARGEPAAAGNDRRDGRRAARSSARVRPCARSWS